MRPPSGLTTPAAVFPCRRRCSPPRVEGLIKRACALPFDLWHLARAREGGRGWLQGTTWAFDLWHLARAMVGHPAPAGMPRACTRLALRLEEAIKERASWNHYCKEVTLTGEGS